MPGTKGFGLGNVKGSCGGNVKNGLPLLASIRGGRGGGAAPQAAPGKAGSRGEGRNRGAAAEGKCFGGISRAGRELERFVPSLRITLIPEFLKRWIEMSFLGALYFESRDGCNPEGRN